eukprot:CAMPEP_0172451990 /NCGR_PEP_ID=MMETSP1065-20121228/9772_1 /TAXON_ID=265537 /ORGANISM="Amphiprora paludosa, Strain CCMP125" /LENGTH=455 /DNA_ID=CAMNT_0013203963 /DNA_START=721 /DNA_END=2088 /DNA_ORIENTATION=+
MAKITTSTIIGKRRDRFPPTSGQLALTEFLSDPTEHDSKDENEHHPKVISIENGVLQLDPSRKPCEALFQAFILSKLVWFLLAELDTQEKTKLLEREVDFARSKLGFTFTNSDTEPEATNSAVVQGILAWAELKVKPKVSTKTFHRLQQTLVEMKSDTNQVCAGRPHRFQRAVESIRKRETEEKDDLPQPLDVTSSDSFAPGTSLPNIQPADLDGLFDSVCSRSVQIEEVPMASPRRITRNTSKRLRATEPANIKAVAGEKRTLNDLKELLDELHPRESKKRCIRSHDVVSGKGERAKQQNQHYLELIRSNAPVFRGMDTGNPDRDLEEKRKMAYRIALEVVEQGGCFVGQDDRPMSPKQAFKRVMTSLKDWRKPRRGITGTTTARVVSNDPTPQRVSTTQASEDTVVDSMEHFGPIADLIDPNNGSSIDDEILNFFERDPSDQYAFSSIDSVDV